MHKIETIVAKREIAHYEHFLILPYLFQNVSTGGEIYQYNTPIEPYRTISLMSAVDDSLKYAG